MLSLIFLVASFVLAVLAGTFSPPAEPWRWSYRLLCFALACFFLSELIRVVPNVHMGG